MSATAMKKSARYLRPDLYADKKSPLLRTLNSFSKLNYADKRARPFALLDFKTRPPARVLALKPCLRLRIILLGLYVGLAIPLSPINVAIFYHLFLKCQLSIEFACPFSKDTVLYSILEISNIVSTYLLSICENL